jgi:hypothetical protein
VKSCQMIILYQVRWKRLQLLLYDVVFDAGNHVKHVEDVDRPAPRIALAECVTNASGTTKLDLR